MEYRLVILPILLVILLALYYTNFKSNMIIMLSLIAVLIIFDLLNNSEHFSTGTQATHSLPTALFDRNTSSIQHILREQALKIKSLEEMIRIIKKYKNKDSIENNMLNYPVLKLRNSCVMLTSDGTDEDLIPEINETAGNSIFNDNNNYHHTQGRDSEVYNQIMNQL